MNDVTDTAMIAGIGLVALAILLGCQTTQSTDAVELPPIIEIVTTPELTEHESIFDTDKLKEGSHMQGGVKVKAPKQATEFCKKNPEHILC